MTNINSGMSVVNILLQLTDAEYSIERAQENADDIVDWELGLKLTSALTTVREARKYIESRLENT